MGGTPHQQPVGMPQAMRGPTPLPERLGSTLVFLMGRTLQVTQSGQARWGRMHFVWGFLLSRNGCIWITREIQRTVLFLSQEVIPLDSPQSRLFVEHSLHPSLGDCALSSLSQKETAIIPWH